MPQTNKERLAAITASIEAGIKDLYQSDKYADYLKTMSRFHKYSLNNTILIHQQKPSATRVAGYNKWRDQFGRTVKQGEKGIKILAPTPFKTKVEKAKLDPDTKLPLLDSDGKAIMEEREITIPMFKPVFVFDMSQTEGKPLPQLAATLTGDVENYQVFLEALKRASPVEISFAPLPSTTDGYFSIKDQSITIRDDMSEIQTVSAIVHEMAHAMLHNPEYDSDIPSQVDQARNVEEIQAESVSFTVCSYYGIQTEENSFGYIGSWAKDKELSELRASLEVISKTADSLITSIDKRYAEVMKEREAELAVETPTEALYLIDSNLCLHVQQSDTGYDYTFYDRETGKAQDGGRMEMEDFQYTTKTDLEAARDEILAFHVIKPVTLDVLSLDVLKELQELNNQQTQKQADESRAAQTAPVPETDPTQTPEPLYLPDPTISIASMNAYGYTNSDMYPLSKERAMDLFERDVTIYMLYDDGSSGLVFEPEDITLFTGLFGVDTEEWNQVKDQIPPMRDPFTQQEQERNFLAAETDSFAIYQLKQDPELHDQRFLSLANLEQMGLSVDRDNYELVYFGTLPPADSTERRLEEVFAAFQDGNRPADFTGKSLSVSDIVAFNQGGVVSCHYCNPIGYKEIPDFFGLEKVREAPQAEKPEKAETVKPKELPIPQEIKTRQPAGKTKKPSVIEKLHRFQAEDRARELKAKAMEDYSL